MANWSESRFTGLFTLVVRAPQRAHDPAVAITAGEAPGWFPGEPAIGCSGAGWSQAEADRACLGEGIERWLARALPTDGVTEAAFARWPLDERAIAPEWFVLFHPEQYLREGFPLAPLTSETDCRWVCCRHALTGEATWVPEEFVYLAPRRGERQHATYGFSTGLSCGAPDDPVVLRGAQEVIERDALVGGWWGVYPVEEWPAVAIREQLGSTLWRRLERPNLTYRFYRIATPFSGHVTLVSLAGEDREGLIFSVGSACRETREASWAKSLLEAVQGRHCVRRLKEEWRLNGRPDLQTPTIFFEHALYYTLHPERLSGTVLERGLSPDSRENPEKSEGLADLCDRLGIQHPVLVRNLTPPFLARGDDPWLVLRVVIPGLQPLHADHRLPFLGGPFWRGRPLSDWAAIPPHPFA